MRRLFLLVSLLFLVVYVAHAASPPPCSVPTTPIHAVQGSGTTSPLVGMTVTIEGIVVGDFQGGGLGVSGDVRGFYVQEQDGEADTNPATSEGVFVFDGTTPGVDVAVGDAVCVTGQVNEFFGETQINATVVGGGVLVESMGNPLPTPRVIALPLAGTVLNSDGWRIGDYEAYEGERVVFPDPLTITGTATLDSYGDLMLSSDGRLVAFTQTNAPSVAGFAAWDDDQARRRIQLDDGFSAANPNPMPYPAPALSLTNRLRAGDVVSNLVGTIRYSRGAGPDGDELFRLMPTAPPTFTTSNPRPAPPLLGGDVTVASFNMERFYNGNGGGPGGFPSSGADTFAEFLRQRDKLIAAIVQMNADIVGLVELENDYVEDLESAIYDLTSALNAVLGAGTYAYIDPGANLGTGPIAVGLLYKPASVSPVGDHVVLDTPEFGNPNGYAFHLNRPALTQTFQGPGGGAFTVIVNHFKAKSCSPTPTGLDVDQGDGQACFNDTRTKGGAELVEWLANDPTNTSFYLGETDTDFLIIGDLNAHPQEDPIAALKAGYDGIAGNGDDFVDLLSASDHSFVFQGAASRLDYALASPTLAPQIAGATVWNINADEPDAFDYNEDLPAPAALYAPDPYRSSDHDPVVVGINTAPLMTILSSFEARTRRHVVQLRWVTEREVNNRGFEVQHRAEGEEEWKVVGRVRGHGTTNKPKRYRWVGKRFAAGIHGFRLRIVSKDGSFQYSPELEVEVEGKSQGMMSEPYPNPFNPQTAMTLTVDTPQHVRVVAYDLLGREVAVLFDGPLAAGQAQHVVFDAGHLATGTYLLRAEGETFVTTTRAVLTK